MSQHDILVVDDKVNILELLRDTLKGEHNILSATSGEDALSIMERHDVALILTDYRMPGMTGTELLEKVMQKHPDTIRLIMSAYSDELALMVADNKVHAHAILTKPWRNEEVRFIIRRWVEQYELTKELQEKVRELEERAGQSEEDLQRDLVGPRQREIKLTRKPEQSQEPLDSSLTHSWRRLPGKKD